MAVIRFLLGASGECGGLARDVMGLVTRPTIDVLMCNILIRIHKKGRQPEQALLLFEAMKHLGLVPDVLTHNALVIGSGRPYDKAQQLQLRGREWGPIWLA